MSSASRRRGRHAECYETTQMKCQTKRQMVEMITLLKDVPVGEILATYERQRTELTYSEAAALMGCSKKTVSNLISRGALTRIRRGIVSRHSVMAYRSRQRCEVPRPADRVVL